MGQNENFLKKIANDGIDILWAGILWLLFSLPLLTAGAASCALYYTVVKVVRRKRETIAKAFFHSFRQNLRQGMAVTVIYAVWIEMIFIIIRGYRDGAAAFLNGYVLTVLLILLAVPLLLTGVYIIPVISRFSFGLLRQFQLALLLAVRHLPSTIYLIFLMGLALLMLYQHTSWIFLIPGAWTFISSFIVEKILTAFLKEQKERFGRLDEDAWYMEE